MITPKVIHEDTNLLVLDKPAGLVVHEGINTKDDTLVDWVAQKYPKLKTVGERYGLLHRLDKETSGLILVAKTQATFDYMKNLFKTHEIQKTYLVLVKGKLAPEQGMIDIPISRDIVNRTKYQTHSLGRVATTKYKVVKYYKDFTLLEAMPITGRTHQIRVHFSGIGFPLAGDKTYGRTTPGLTRHFLHAHKIEFLGMDQKSQTYTSELAEDLKTFLDGLN